MKRKMIQKADIYPMRMMKIFLINIHINILYIYEDKDKNKKMYTYHKEHEFIYDLRCQDRNCDGRA